MIPAARLVLLRHGQSEWNAASVFTGWENAHLTAHGEAEAARAGSMLAKHGALPAFVHTSLQHRTIRTAELTLTTADRDWIPVRRSWRLNGRHYGALQGSRKDQVRRAAQLRSQMDGKEIDHLRAAGGVGDAGQISPD